MPKYLIASCLDKTVTDNVGQDAVEGAKAFTTVITTGDDRRWSSTARSSRSTRLTSTRTAWRTWATWVITSLGEVGKESACRTDHRAAVHHRAEVGRGRPRPRRPGLTFTCNGQAFPKAPNLCSTSILVSDVGADGKLSDSTVVN